ncbi:hypothetical protein K449DRAFT_462312 [Hypoxylon sp. EC38]|nr:hypothetical protein K449DRAFT_462312 [Hypoxylon sp. EC38]
MKTLDPQGSSQTHHPSLSSILTLTCRHITYQDCFIKQGSTITRRGVSSSTARPMMISRGKRVLELREEFGRWVTTVSSDEKRCISRPRYNYFLSVEKEVLYRFQRVDAARVGMSLGNYIGEEVVAIVIEVQSIHWKNHSYEKE